VSFDWQNDVIDFDDALKAAQAISDSSHLKRVHRFVIDALPSFFPDRTLVQAALQAKRPIGGARQDWPRRCNVPRVHRIEVDGVNAARWP
jgi:hypothetical protein